MSSIERLSIQGIRSFSPDEEQVIRFKKPITLICGPNGAGKSTIIECLKYATTGILPPGTGNKSGQAFIFDPDLANSSEVKATIKLLFRNRSRAYTLVQRHFKVTQKKSKKEFKALDGVIKMKDPKTGEDISQSNRCSDLDKLVPELLGVSPAILDNVIFCHQEENNWPLKESAELKKKFDDIFESTRYTKALVELRKSKKEVMDKAKDAKRDVEVLATHLERANQLRAELEETKLLLEENQERSGNLDAQLDEHRKNVAAVQEQLQKYEGTFQRIREMTGMIAERERMIASEAKEHPIDADLATRSLEELREIHRTINTEFETTSSSMNKAGQQRQAKEQEKISLLSQIEALSTERANLNARVEEATRQLKRHETLAIEARGKYPKYLKSEKPSPSETKESMILLVKDKREEVAKAEQAQRNRYEHDSKEIESVRGEATALGHQKQSLENEHRKMEQALDDVVSRLTNLGEDSNDAETRVKEAKALVHEKSKKMTQVRTENASEAKKKSIEDTKKEMEKLDERKASLESGLSKLEAQQETMMRLRTKRNEVTTKALTVQTRFLSIQTSLFGLDPSIATHFHETVEACSKLKLYWTKGESSTSPSKKMRMTTSTTSTSISHDVETTTVPRVEFKRITEHLSLVLEQVRAITQARRKELEKTKQESDRIVEETTLLVGELKQTKSELAKLFKAKTDLEESLPKHEFLDILDSVVRNDGETKEDAALRMLRHACDAARKDCNMQDYLETAYRGFIKVNRDGKGCTICNQSCDKIRVKCEKTVEYKEGGLNLKFLGGKEYVGDEAFQLQLVLKLDADAMREARHKLEGTLKQSETRLKDFSKHVPTARKLEDVEQRLIECQDQQRLLEERKDELSRQGQKLGAMSQSLELPLKEAERIEKELAETFRICKDAERMEEDADREDRMFGDTSSGEGVQSLEQARLRLRQLSTEKDKLTEKILEDTRALQNIQLEQEQAMTSLTEAQKLVQRLEKEASERFELTKERKRISDLLASLVQQVESLRLKIIPLDRRCEDLEENRKKTQETAKKELDRLRNDLDTCISEQKTLESARDASESAMKNGVRERFAEVTELLRAQRAKLTSLDDELKTIASIVSTYDVQTRKTDIMRRSLLNAIRVAQSKEELSSMTEEKGRLEEQVKSGHSGSSSLRQELNRLETIVRDVSLKKEKLAGGREAHEKRVNSIQAQLLDSTLKDVDRRHADQLVVSVTTAMAAKDLERYCKALDTALMRFHAEMVEDINKRIRELWQLTYRGGDIDRVELKAEQGTGVSAHTYTYRVVMRKNHTELDMRGRCSAGQKVLASLVIRLALADTFSTKCGVLALDEPSTNLDFENKKGLAEALAEIIKSRANQSNFQLVVITHDDEFVEIIQSQLGSSGGPFYRLIREQDQSGKYVSRIREEMGSG